VQQLVEKVAPTSATVLLLGESGAGKTLAARLIHELSDRAHHPFVKVNCAAIPEEVLEAELFGQAEGPLSGIKGARPGRLEEAHKGALLLDEIGELSPGTQGKLLRFLQEKEFERVGGGVRRVDVRVIAATNTELEKAVERGEFREDLYYRLNVFPITIPPLRRRREDIPSLLNHFLERLSREYGRRLVLTPAALDALVKYDWPGNVREMENLMERLSILVESGSIDVGDIPASLFSSPAAHVHRGGAPMSLQEMEKNEVVTALERHRWVQSRAARELGLTLRQMGYRVKKFGLEQLVHQRRREYRRAG
jgi:Nif-specific regulatory protein